MKLNDIDQNLNEAPVNMLRRAATKLQKHTPFNKDARTRAQGRDVLQKAANDLNTTWQHYIGQAGIDPNNVSPEQLLGFLKSSGYLKTGKKIVSAAVEKKGSQTTTDNQGQQEMNFTPESFERRLANLLNEDSSVSFNNKEVQKLLLDIVKEVHRENPVGLEQKVSSAPEAGSNQAQPSEVLTPEELQEFGGYFDNFAADVIKAVNNSKISTKEKNKINREIINRLRAASKEIGFKMD